MRTGGLLFTWRIPELVFLMLVFRHGFLLFSAAWHGLIARSVSKAANQVGDGQAQHTHHGD